MRAKRIIGGVRLGIAHHFGWAVAVTASADHKVVDRRRIALIEPGMPTAPIHHEGKPLENDATAVLVAQVRASAVRATSDALDELATALPEPIVSMSLRAWSLDFPQDIAVQRRSPYWLSGPTRSCSGRGQRWVRPGQRTTGWRSPRRSSPARRTAPGAEAARVFAPSRRGRDAAAKGGHPCPRGAYVWSR
jgi:hypothetical protein